MNNMIRNSIAAFLMAVGSAASSATVPFSFGEVKVDCEDRDGWTLAFSREVASDGAEIAKIVLDCPEAKTPPKTRLSLMVPQVGMDYAWNVNTGDCGMRPNWSARSQTEVAQGMPVYVYFDGNDTSHFSVAAEECAMGSDPMAIQNVWITLTRLGPIWLVVNFVV